MLTHLSLFSGIGGIDISAEWAGFESVAFVEQNPFCQKVLAKHWPGVPIYDDITTFSGAAFRHRIDLISGGFPCQDISQAGKQAGLSGKRSGLWFEMLRVISEVRPAWVLAENVGALVRMGIDTCLAGLEAESYTTRAVVLPACSVGAVHRRERCFIVAHDDERARFDGSSESVTERTFGENWADDRAYDFADAENMLSNVGSSKSLCDKSELGDSYGSDACDPGSCGLPREPRWRAGKKPLYGYTTIQSGDWRTWGVKPVVCRGDDGLSGRVDRLRSLGNAVVPQQVYPILKAIAKELGC